MSRMPTGMARLSRATRYPLEPERGRPPHETQNIQDGGRGTGGQYDNVDTKRQAKYNTRSAVAMLNRPMVNCPQNSLLALNHGHSKRRGKLDTPDKETGMARPLIIAV